MYLLQAQLPEYFSRTTQYTYTYISKVTRFQKMQMKYCEVVQTDMHQHMSHIMKKGCLAYILIGLLCTEMYILCQSMEKDTYMYLALCQGSSRAVYCICKQEWLKCAVSPKHLLLEN